MAYLMLYGNGWTQRWRLPEGEEDRVRSEIIRVGTDDTAQFSVIEPRTDSDAVLVVSWAAVAAAAVVDAESDPEHDTTPGQYA